MHKKEEDLGGNHIEGEKSRSHRRQGSRTSERDIKTGEIIIRGPKWDQDQW